MPFTLIENNAVITHGQNLGITVDDLRAVLEEYRAAVENALGTWAGLASDSFRAFDAQFQQLAQTLVTSLETMQTEVDAAGIQYENTETEQQAAMESLGGALGGFAVPR